MSEAEVLPNPYDDAMERSDNEAADILSGMVKASLAEGAMPPREIMSWYMKNITLMFMHIEFDSVFNPLSDEKERESIDAAIRSSVQNITMFLAILRKNKMLTLENELISMLNARKLRFPTHMDLTYGNNLP